MAGEALSGIRVIDFSRYRTGAQASQLFADFGADVIHVEPVGGTALRKEAAWPFWGRGKRAIQLDLRDPADLEIAQGLCRSADVVIETFRPGVADEIGIGYEAMSRDNPGLVHCSITAFGTQGPLVGVKGYEGVVAAKLGAFTSVADMSPSPAETAFISAAYCSYPASQLAIQGILAALMMREDSGKGQKVDVSMAQAMTVHDTLGWFSRVLAMRFEDGFAAVPRVIDGIPTGGLSFRLLIALSKDGRWLQFSQTTPRLFRAMMKMFDLEWMFEDERFATAPDFDDVAVRKEYWEILLAKVREKTVAEWRAEFDRDTNVWAEVFSKDSEILHHPQMVWNRMVATIPDPDLGPVTQPGPIARLDGTPARLERSAPALGEHDAAIRAELVAQAVNGDRAVAGATGGTNDGAPLAGCTIVELGTYYAAPFASTLMAELGARVIKLEQTDGDPHRTMLPFPELSGLKVLQGKESLGVDLGTPEGREIAYRIIAKADVVLQSFRAGAAERLGLDAATLLALNPDLVYHAAPGYGEDGPCGKRPAFAPTAGAGAGLAWRNAGASVRMGPDLTLDEVKRGAMQLATAVMGVGNSDGISAVTAASAMILGIYARKRGHGGQKILTSMLSSTAHSLGEIMVEYADQPPFAVADHELRGFSSLYRLYRGSDGWLFFAAPKEKEWRAFLAAVPEAAELAGDQRFATAADRAEHDAALVEKLAELFAARAPQDWEQLLAAADVACVACAPAPVEANYQDEGSVGDLCGYVTDGHHAILDDVIRLTPLVRFSEAAGVTGNAGLVGEETTKILKEFGYGAEEIARLEEAGVIVAN